MGLFWDLIQQSQIPGQRKHASSLEGRLLELERDLDETKRVLRLTLEHLERSLGEDIDRDGRIG